MKTVNARYRFAKVTYISKEGKQVSWTMPNLSVNMQEGDSVFLKNAEGFEYQLTAKTNCKVYLSVVGGAVADYKIDKITQRQGCRYKNNAAGTNYIDKELTVAEALI